MKPKPLMIGLAVAILLLSYLILSACAVPVEPSQPPTPRQPEPQPEVTEPKPRVEPQEPPPPVRVARATQRRVATEHGAYGDTLTDRRDKERRGNGTTS